MSSSVVPFAKVPLYVLIDATLYDALDRERMKLGVSKAEYVRMAVGWMCSNRETLGPKDRLVRIGHD